jgi:ribose 5-phosphate isomerase B
MKIFLGSDHRGFKLKEALLDYLIDKGYEAYDFGAYLYDKNDDYPDMALAVAKKVSQNPKEYTGILFCGSGHGVDMVANKVRGVRSALAFNDTVAKQAREHENANIASIPADWVNLKQAKKIADIWLKTKFSGGTRHKRRLKKLESVEHTFLH